MKFGVSYFGNRIIKHVIEDMKYIKKEGFNVVVHTFSENDFKYYRKTMKDIIDISKDLGLEVWIDPWGFGGVFGGEAFSDFLIQNPEEWQINNLGEKVGGVCLNSKKFIDYIKEWIDFLSDSNVDYIFWDEPHFYIDYKRREFPEIWSCRCEKCKTKYKEIYGKEMPIDFTTEVKDFRFNTIKDFLKEVTSYSAHKSIKNAICFLPIDAEEAGFELKNIKYIVKNSKVSNVGLDPYWIAFNMNMEPLLSNSLEIIDNFSNEYQKHIWLQAFKIPSGREEELLIASEKILKNSKVDYLLFWGIYACEHISSIAPENPKEVWDTVLKIVKTYI